MKIQKFGRSGIAYHCEYFVSSDEREYIRTDDDQRKVAYADFVKNRDNGESWDVSRQDIDRKKIYIGGGSSDIDYSTYIMSYNGDREGRCVWIKGEFKGGYVYGVKRPDGKYDYELRYEPGPEALAYFERKDRNYLTRLIREKVLREKEPVVWYLYETDNSQNLNIADWWSQKLKLSAEELDKLFEDASKKSISCLTEVHEAALKKDVATLKKFIQNSPAPLNHKCSLGKTPLDYAYEFGLCDAITLLKESKAEETIINKGFLLSRAVEAGDLQWLKLLFDAKANVNFQDSYGLTALHKAIQLRYDGFVDQLLSVDTIDISLKSKDGKTPLAYLEAMDLFKAASDGDLVWLKRLLKLGADINSQNAKGNSSLQQAILSDKDEVAKWLITESKINLELQSEEARTALHYAALTGKLELVKLLIDKKAILDVKDGLEKTPRDLAIENKYANVAACLRVAMNKPVIVLPDVQEEKISQMQAVINPEAKAVGKELESYAIKYDTLKYSENDKLGEGGFGVVYKGRWQNIDVAIKQLHLKNLSQEALQEFSAEAETMTKLRFPNIVTLYGVCLEPNKYSMVMELMPKGSLYNLLHNRQPLPWKTRFNISMDIATGLAYLHSKKILHRDLKSPNILLDQNLRAKLADFGLAHVRHETMTTSTMANQTAGSLPWMAPELFQRKARYTEAADIYSTGMIFWEITSRKKPFEDAFDQTVLKDWVKDGEKETIPESTPAEYKNVLSWCWSAAKNRPTANQIIEKLKANAKSIEQFDQKVDDVLLSGPVYK